MGRVPLQVMLATHSSMVSTSTNCVPFQCCSRIPSAVRPDVIKRVVNQLNPLADVVGKRHHPVAKRRASAIAFRVVIELDLEQGQVVAFSQRELFPPVLQTVDDKIILDAFRRWDVIPPLPTVFHRALARPRICAFNVAKTCSMGFRPGLYGGRSWTPQWLCAPR